MNSSKYFEKRSEMRMKKAHDKATVSMARVNKAYDNSLSRLKKEIKSLTKDFEGMKPEEVRDFLNGYISYDRHNEWLKIYKTTKDKVVKKEMEKLIKANATGFRIRRKEAMLRDIEMERLAMTGSQLDNFGSHLRNVYKSTLNETGFKGVNKNLIDEAMKHNWAGSNYSKRVWHNNKVLAKKIETNLFESFISGKSNKQIVDELEYLTDLGRHAANRLVRTETSYMVNSADLESSKQRGIKAKKFEATLDSRTSKVCRRHNQKIISIDKIKIGENAPPLHPYCRSFLADVLQGWDYENDEELAKLIGDEYKDNKALEKNNANIEVNSKDGYNNYKNQSVLQARTIKEANKIAENMGYQADYKGIDIKCANEWNEGLFNAKRDFPEIADKIKFVGSSQKRYSLMKKEIQDYYEKTLDKQFRSALEDAGISNEKANKWIKDESKNLSNLATKGFRTKANNMASSWSYVYPEEVKNDPLHGGMYKIKEKYHGITMNDKYFDHYDKVLESGMRQVKYKWHPEGGHTVKATFDHEFAHQIDDYLALRNNEKIIKLWESQTKESLKENLSEYAFWDGKNKHKDAGEMIAEAWSEYCNNKNPRGIANTVGKEIKKAWQKK